MLLVASSLQYSHTAYHSRGLRRVVKIAVVVSIVECEELAI
jgi:hypothetical protein